MATEIEIKTERLARSLNVLNYKGVLLSGQHNFAWITGGSSNGVDSSRDSGVASILITDQGRRYIFANSIEMPRMLTEEVSQEDFEPVEYSWQDERSDPLWTNRVASDILGGQVVSDLPFDTGVPAIEGSIASQRYSLTDHEIERFRLLGRDAGKAISDTVRNITPGQTELEIASVMRSEFEKFNIRPVVALVAADRRIAQYRHPVPTDNTFKHTLMLVACARRGGLIASLSRIVTVGPASSALLEKTSAAALVNATLWNATKPGADARGLYDVAATAYASVGHSDEINKHHQGGAAGYRTRDWIIHPGCLETVQRDQAFAWNPSITGTKVEETVIATNGTCEVITNSPGWPTIAHTIDGVEYLSPGVLEI